MTLITKALSKKIKKSFEKVLTYSRNGVIIIYVDEEMTYQQTLNFFRYIIFLFSFFDSHVLSLVRTQCWLYKYKDKFGLTGKTHTKVLLWYSFVAIKVFYIFPFIKRRWFESNNLLWELISQLHINYWNNYLTHSIRYVILSILNEDMSI